MPELIEWPCRSIDLCLGNDPPSTSNPTTALRYSFDRDSAAPLTNRIKVRRTAFDVDWLELETRY